MLWFLSYAADPVKTFHQLLTQQQSGLFTNGDFSTALKQITTASC